MTTKIKPNFLIKVKKNEKRCVNKVMKRREDKQFEQRLITVENDLHVIKKDYLALETKKKISAAQGKDRETRDKEEGALENNHTIKQLPNIEHTNTNSCCSIIVNNLFVKPKRTRNISTSINDFYSPFTSQRSIRIREQLESFASSNINRNNRLITSSLLFKSYDNPTTPMHNNHNYNRTLSNNNEAMTTEDFKSTQLQTAYHSDVRLGSLIGQKMHNQLTDSRKRALNILSNSLILTPQERITLVYSNKEILSNSNPYKILSSSYDSLVDSIHKLQIELNHKKLLFNEKRLLNRINNYPSKTAQMAISFITKTDEQDLIEGDDAISNYLIHLLYVLLQEEENYDTVKRGYFHLFEKHKIDSNSIKELLLNVISNIVFYDDGRYDRNERERLCKDIKSIINLFHCAIKDKDNKDNTINTTKKYNQIEMLLNEIRDYLQTVPSLPNQVIDIFRKSRRLQRMKIKLNNISTVMKRELYN